MQQINEAIETSTNLVGDWQINKTGKVLKVTLTFSEPEEFVDENGVKWVRA